MAGGGLPLQTPRRCPDVAILRGPARKNTRPAAAFMAAIALAAITRTADVEGTAAQTALTQDQQDRDGQTSRVANTREAVVKEKGWGASAGGVRGFLLVKARSWCFGPSLLYHLHNKYEAEQVMADAAAANADDCPESDLNEMTVEWEKGLIA